MIEKVIDDYGTCSKTTIFGAILVENELKMGHFPRKLETLVILVHFWYKTWYTTSHIRVNYRPIMG